MAIPGRRRSIQISKSQPAKGTHAYRVRGFPALIAYSRGEEVERFHGVQPESFLCHLIDRLVEHHHRDGARFSA
jgi:thioredoxin-like negative regulator of GroEL